MINTVLFGTIKHQSHQDSWNEHKADYLENADGNQVEAFSTHLTDWAEQFVFEHGDLFHYHLQVVGSEPVDDDTLTYYVVGHPDDLDAVIEELV